MYHLEARAFIYLPTPELLELFSFARETFNVQVVIPVAQEGLPLAEDPGYLDIQL